jgi:hypothetical protein
VKENQVEWERARKRGGVENTKTRCSEHRNAVSRTPKRGVQNTKQNAVWKKKHEQQPKKLANF